ncbi:S41 family peptidase [Streptomyces sp. NPDC088789]|uniref:S41 family peptidase n=1 Tax=Streptomyces sp. NPDC088789 TaxID=3365899 RepID=UPI003800EEEC
MSGRDLFCQPRRARRGATLTLVFASVLVAGAATGSLPLAGRGPDVHGGPGATRAAAPAARHDEVTEVTEAAADALAEGKSAVEAAERAVSRSGDRWGSVYTEGEFAEFEEALDGAYTGVGLSARRERDGRIEVTEVSTGSPADGAGIRVGDRIVSIDGKRVAGLPVTEVVALLRGAPQDAHAGTAVRLGLERGPRAWQQTLRRARLSTDPVTVRELPGGVTLIKVTAFTRGTGDFVRDAVREARSDAGLVLDLRGNSGGLVSEAVTAASAFLDGGLVATYDVDGRQRALHAESGGDTARPLVALVDGGTMSAAELVTGALQDRSRAVVVGSRTFGKGSVQMPTELPDGSVAELTVGHYRTPAGRAVDGKGITPDLEADGDAALDRAGTVLTGLGR